MKLVLLTTAALALAAPAFAAAPAKAGGPAAFLPGSNSKEPISIDASKLVYFDKEQKAIYTGDVVVIQGDSKLTCSMLTIFLAKDPATDANAAKPDNAEPAKADAPAGPAAGSSQVKHMDAAGPVVIVSKTQVATGDRAVYDKPENKVWMFGHVTLSDGSNVTNGDKLTYDLTTGQAVIEGGQRVHGLFIPGAGDTPGAGGGAPGAERSKAAPKNKINDARPTKP